MNQPELALRQADAQVTVNIAATATDGFNASLQSRCKVVGDFDARATFQLLQWPGVDGVWVSLMAADLGGVNTYRSDSFGEIYGAYIPPSGGTSVPTHDTGGVVRLTREGDTIAGSYRVGTEWTTIFSGTGPTAKTAISLAVFNLPDVAPFAGRAASVRFSAFTLTANRFDC